MNVSCFRSTQPAAVNASILFDFHTNLWERRRDPVWSAGTRMCSRPAAPYTVMMEAMGRSVEITAAADSPADPFHRCHPHPPLHHLHPALLSQEENSPQAK